MAAVSFFPFTPVAVMSVVRTSFIAFFVVAFCQTSHKSARALFTAAAKTAAETTTGAFVCILTFCTAVGRLG